MLCAPSSHACRFVPCASRLVAALLRGVRTRKPAVLLVDVRLACRFVKEQRPATGPFGSHTRLRCKNRIGRGPVASALGGLSMTDPGLLTGGQSGIFTLVGVDARVGTGECWRTATAAITVPRFAGRWVWPARTGVMSSRPPHPRRLARTFQGFVFRDARMAELVYAPDLGSGPSPGWGFESPFSHGDGKAVPSGRSISVEIKRC